MIQVRFAVLGPLEVRVGPAALPVPVGRQRRLLAALLLARGAVVSADRLIDVIWGEEPPDNARNALQTCVTRLRRSLASVGDVVLHQPPGYRLDLGAASTDADDFVRLFERSRAVSTPDQRAAVLDEALALWRGPAWGELAGDVARGDALRLEELLLAVREGRAAALLASGRAVEAIGVLEVLLGESPLRDETVSLLARAHCAAGRTADALAVLARHRRLVADELGLDPAPDLVRLQDRILRQGDLPSPAPPSASPALGSQPPALPRRAAGLVGRIEEAEHLGRLWRAHPLVTVVGPGGVGKTRLVHHVVSTSGEPVWWVDLAAVRDPGALPQVVADVLHVESFPGACAADSLPGALARRSGILVLDNCEHLVTAVAHLVASALERPGTLHVLATSRERLGIEGEWVLVLPPLPVPDSEADDETLASSPAVALFLDRARAAAPDLEPDLEVEGPALRRVAQICRSLDGLPLAIELAAARVGTLTVDDLAERLDARFELLTVAPRTGPAKHRTLRAVVDWSYDLLEPVERAVFGRLAVFPAAFDLAAAEAVAGGPQLAPAEVADVVARLAERSMLVRPGGFGRGRYRMLETLRQYAVTRIDGAELEQARRRHAAWVLAIAERAEEGLLGPDEVDWTRRLTELLPDLRTAFVHGRRVRDGELATRLTAAVLRWAYWQLRTDVLDWGAQVIADGLEGSRKVEAHAASAAARWVEGRLALARAIAQEGVQLAGGPASPQAGVALSVIGDTALCAGDLEEAAAVFAASQRCWTAAGRGALAVMDQLNESLALAVCGRVAPESVEQAVRAARRLGNPSLLAFALYVHGEVLGDDEPTRAQHLLGEALALAESVENRLVAGVARTTAVSLRGRHGAADTDSFSLFHRAVSHWHRAGTLPLLLTTLRNLVPLLVRAGSDEAAIELAAAVEGCAGTKPTFGPEAERLVDAIAQARARVGPSCHAAAWDRGCTRSLDDATARVLGVLAAGPGVRVPP